MNKNIQQLYEIAAKKSRRIIGLMSGTSLDGLDIAICNIENAGFDTKIIVEHFETVPYTELFKEQLKEICFRENISLQSLTLMNKFIAEVHAGMINNVLAEKNIHAGSVDLIASHGQTIFHAPLHQHQLNEFGNATLQIGDADHLAVKTGIITISDFRQKNIASGGEGAPLAAYGDQLLFSDKEHDVLLLNIGGISNFTLLKKNGEIICSDIGPGNTLMDQTMTFHFPGKYFDENAAVALSGNINEELLKALKDHSFLSAAFPKTTGPELFNLSYIDHAQTGSDTQNISAEDKMATLNKLSADLIIDALKKVNAENALIYASGGGASNPLLMQHLKVGLNTDFRSTLEKGIHPDAKEAVLFALLANEAVAGDPGVFGNLVQVSMGKVSFPGVKNFYKSI